MIHAFPDPPLRPPRPTSRSLHGELLLLVAQQARRVPGPMLLSSSMMALMLTAYLPVALPAAWLAVVALVIAVRTRVLVGLPADPSRSEERKLTVAALAFAASGASQASVLAFFPHVPATISAVMSIYIVGVCAGTLSGTAGFRRIFLPYTLLTMGPIALVWGLFADFEASAYERFVFVALALLFSKVLLDHARGTYQVFVESYNIRLHSMALNEQLREALDKAESANRAKTRFLASASHDLRQPIHALSLFSGSLLLRQLDQRTHVIAEQIDKAVKALASQLDALLDISRLDAGIIDKNIINAELRPVLAQLAEEFSPQATRKGLQLSMRCPDSMLVRSDPMLLQRILRNLLSNAIKYTDTGRIDLRVESLPARCRIIVSDTGAGIPASEHARVFEEFYQLHNPERDRTKGLGLGLAIVRRLTELLGIDLRLESTPGQGSRFLIEVPAALGPEVPRDEIRSLPAPVAPHIQVLVVDDEEAIRLGMRTLLEEMGFGVRVAASTAAAVDAAQQLRPSIILADFRLRGDDDGMRTIRALRRFWPDLPALLISGDTAPDRLREAHDAGIELLHKPVNSVLLRSSILSAIDR